MVVFIKEKSTEESRIVKTFQSILSASSKKLSWDGEERGSNRINWVRIACVSQELPVSKGLQ